MKKIPTAEEFYRTKNGMTPPEMMVEFTRLHVKAALSAASYKATTRYSEYTDAGHHHLEVNRESILSAYPLENIKL